MTRIINPNKRTHTVKSHMPAWLAAVAMLTVLFTGAFSASANKASAGLVASTGKGATTAQAPATAFRFPAYFIEWGVYEDTHNYVPADIPTDAITTINYAFVNPIDTNNDGMYEIADFDSWAAEQKPMQRLVPGTDVSQGENLGAFNQLRVLRRNHPNLKVLMSVGGWTLSGNFPTIASTQQQRDHFSAAAVQFMQDKHFDGIDIDWEFPQVADRDNFTHLLQSLRDHLDALTQTTGIYYPLTIAAPPNPTIIANVNVPAVAAIIDWANVMTYDYGGGFDNIASHNSPLCAATGNPHGDNWDTAGTIQTYLDDGMPAAKMNLGMAYYGRAVQHLQNVGPDPSYPGRFAPITPNDFVQGTWDQVGHESEWTGAFDYWNINDSFTGGFQESITPIPGIDGYTRYWDAQQDTPFVFRSDAVGPSGHGVWLSYDDPQSLTNRVNYARTLGLGGVFAWELSQESHPGQAEHPLTNAIETAITGPLYNFTCGGGGTPTPSPTNTATIPPTQTPGGPTATNTPTRTSTSVPTSTSTSTATNTVAPTQTPGGPTATNTPVPPTSTSVPPTATAVGTVCTIEFVDVPEGSTFYSYVKCLACLGIINGYSDGTFRPNNNVTRGQLSKIVSNAAGFEDVQTTQLFQDVAPGSTFYDFAGRLASRGYIGGYPCGGAGEPCGSGNMPYFRPNNNATRGQIAKIVSNAANLSDTPNGQMFQDVAAGSTFYDYIYRLASRGYINGYPCGGAGEPCGSGNMPYFRPNNNATRGQTAKVVSNTFFPTCLALGRPAK